jgi:hypothetical protein
MKFQVAAELQRRWIANPPEGWTAEKELDLLSKDERELLGYRPLVDIVLTNLKSRRRLWIELEISRADPVANHAKFASAHLMHPVSHEDAFVSLVSNHVTRGRANLAAHTIHLMRAGGIRAFQMPLLKDFAGVQISRINQGKIPLSGLPTPDLREVIELTEPVTCDHETEIYYTTNCLEVILNVRQWNMDAQTGNGRNRWGNRRVKYLVFDRRTGMFAPSKFCAYSRIRKPMATPGKNTFNPSMTIDAYSRIPHDHGIFDGQKAWKQLSKIGFHKLRVEDASRNIREMLAAWVGANSNLVTINLNQCEILIET